MSNLHIEVKKKLAGGYGRDSRILKLRVSGPEGRHILCRWREPPVCDHKEPEA